VPYGPATAARACGRIPTWSSTRAELLGPDGDIMLDCWMAFNEQYTIEFAEIGWRPTACTGWRNVCRPTDFEGLRPVARGPSNHTRIAHGVKHVYFRYGFRHLLEHNAAAIWQPDIHWCGGLTELRRIAALASAYRHPRHPHGGGVTDWGVHFTMATVNAPWSEMFMPAPGGPPEVYRRFEETTRSPRRPRGAIYMPPVRTPGFGLGARSRCSAALSGCQSPALLRRRFCERLRDSNSCPSGRGMPRPLQRRGVGAGHARPDEDQFDRQTGSYECR